MTASTDPAPSEPNVERWTLRGWPRRALRRFLLIVLRFAIGFRIEGVERAPTSGGVLVVSNHLHNADPILMAIAVPRSVHYMAKKEVFTIPVVRTLLRFVGAFPVDRRKADRAAIRRAEAALSQGVAVGMFPEGTRSTTLALASAFSGAGLLALRNDVPVLPAVITGTERLPFNGAKGRAQASVPVPERGHRGVRVVFGEPFTIERERDGRRVSADEATNQIMSALARLLPPDYRGVYADRPSLAALNPAETATPRH